MTIKDWLENTTVRLSSADIPSARLDAELLIADAMGKDRTWLISHGEQIIPTAALENLEKQVLRRTQREPLAYIRGYKEFYGRNFGVTPDSLIPRPETETLVEVVLGLSLGKTPRIHDVGTGSGCIPITLGLELPSARVSGSDISHAALEVARRNADALHATNVSFYKDNLLDRSTDTYDVITANLPYVDPSWETSPETISEPSLALYAGDNGLELIKRLIEQAPDHLATDGYLVLEADPRQHSDIIAFAASHQLTHASTRDFVVSIRKI